MWPLRKVAPTILLTGIFLFGVNGDNCKGNEDSILSKLHTCIKSNYDYTVRPVKDQSAAVDVNSTFTVRYINMNDKENILSVHVYVELTWMDQFINWDPSDYGGIRSTILSLSDVWSPDLQVYNERIFWGSGSSLYFPDVHVYNTGLMYAVTQGEIVAHCNLDVYRWPFDVHKCMAYVGSTNYFGNQMRINFGREKVKTNMFLNSSIWELVDVKAKMTNFTHVYGNNTKYEYLRYDKTFIVRRYSTTLFVTVAAPFIAGILLTLGSLWIDPSELSRMLCILTSIFIHISLLQYLGEQLPSNAQKGVLLLSLLRDSLILTFLTFVVTVVNRQMQNFKTTPPHAVTSLVGKLSATGPSKFLLLPDESAQNASEDEVSLVKSGNKFKHEWVLITSLVDRLSFIVFSFIYASIFILYCTL